MYSGVQQKGRRPATDANVLYTTELIEQGSSTTCNWRAVQSRTPDVFPPPGDVEMLAYWSADGGQVRWFSELPPLVTSQSLVINC